METPSAVYIGTSGWSYPQGEGTWNGHFYPAGTKDELEYYSRLFNTVEVNSTFYRPPEARLAQSWAKRVPPGFLFSVKLWQKFTHPGMFSAATGEDATVSRADIDQFRAGIEPLASRGKLGALLAQFPPGFVNSAPSREILGALLSAFREYRLAVELRHKSWSDDPAIAELLKANRAAWARRDEPRFSFSIASDVPVTSELAYFRFHGRNAEMWWKGNAETRYKYLYSPEEIQELASRVKAAAGQSKPTFAFFNNHWRGYAPKNAADLIRSLQLPFNDLL